MLWRTDIHFLSSRGDSRGLYPAFTRCLQPADDLRQLEGSLCAPWLPGFSQHLGSKHWRPTPPTLALCYHCRAWTNTWEAFLSNPLSEQKLKPRRGAPTEPRGRWGRAKPNRTEPSRATALSRSRDARSRSVGRAGSRPTDSPGSQSKAELPS